MELGLRAARPRGALGGLVGQVADMARSRDLLILLVQKDLKVKYKGTALGFFWSLLNPLLMMLVYTAVFSRFSNIHNYPVFLLSGLLPWNAFAVAITTASMSVIANANLVRRVRFPLEFLPLTPVLSGLVNLLLSLCILVVFALVFRQPLGLPLVTLPLLLILQLVLTAGVSLVLSALMVYFRDTEYLVTVGMTAFFFLTPILYSINAQSGRARFLSFLRYNPMTWLMTSYQAIWYGDTWPNWRYVAAFAAFAVVILVVGRQLFRRLAPRFAEEV